MRIVLSYWGEKISSVFKGLFFYISLGVIFALVLSIIYRICFIEIVRGFLCYNSNSENNMDMIVFIIGIVINTIGGAVLVALLLKPAKLMTLADFMTYSAIDQSFNIRYWILLKHREFLYDLNIVVVLVDRNKYNDEDGINSVRGLWNSLNSTTSDVYNIQKARGKRFISISGADAFAIKSAVETSVNNGVRLSDLFLDVSIIGTDRDGHVYHRSRSYVLDKQLVTKYNFAPCDSYEKGYVQYINNINANGNLKQCLTSEFNMLYQFYNLRNYDRFYEIDIVNDPFIDVLDSHGIEANRIIFDEKRVVGFYEVVRLRVLSFLVDNLIYRCFDNRIKIRMKRVWKDGRKLKKLMKF